MEEDELEAMVDYIEDKNIIGIDLGTTNSCASIWRNNNLEIIPDEYGNRTIPSYVAYTNVNRYIGIDAKNQKDINTANVFYEIKRLIGRKINDPYIEKQKHFFSYKIDGSSNGNIVLVSELNNNKKFTPEEISSAILSKLKHMASTYLKTKITKCVITVPAYFNEGQRQATKDAALIAGLDCIRILNEPFAAGIAYGLINRTLGEEDNKKNVLVYDFGGGTLDVTLLRIENGQFEVLANGGNLRIGGSDFDTRLIQYSLNYFRKKHNIKNMDNIQNISLQKLRTSCETAKKILSTNTLTYIAVANFYNNINLYIPLTRQDFETICYDLFLISMAPVHNIINECEYVNGTEDIDEIILVGGMTKTPKIKEMIKTKFGKSPNCSINPDEAIAAGAAIQAYILSNQLDPFSESLTLFDVTSLSLGVETYGGIMDIIIPRNTPIPYEHSRMYTTAEDDQTEIIIKIYEGERPLTKDNYFSNEFKLQGLESAPRGHAEIKVTFKIDQNSMITVSAEDTETNNVSSITITCNNERLSKEEIDNLIYEAQEYEFRDEIEKRQKYYHYEIKEYAENIIANIKAQTCKISDGDKTIIEADMIKIFSWLKEKNYTERTDDEYEKILNTLKKQYGVLLIRGISEKDDKIEAGSISVGNVTSTTVYGNDEEDAENMKNVFDKIEETTLGAQGLSNQEKEELKELRNAVSDICYSIFDIINSEYTKISEEHKQELKDYINDSLLWLHVHEKPTKNEYIIKIDEINETCDKILSHYKNNNKSLFQHCDLISSVKNKRDELENLCIVLKILIDDKAITEKGNVSETILKAIEENLIWLSSHDGQNEDDNQEEKQKEFYNECRIRVDELNLLCSKIQQMLQSINLDDKRDILGEDRVIISDYIEESKEEVQGTSIIALARKNQENILNDMIDAQKNIKCKSCKSYREHRYTKRNFKNRKCRKCRF